VTEVGPEGGLDSRSLWDQHGEAKVVAEAGSSLPTCEGTNEGEGVEPDA
jgi:hypothetical protein